MFRLALSALLMATLPLLAAQATELSPWFGSADTAGFRLELMPMDAATGPAVSAIVPAGNCHGVCPNPPKFAIVQEQDLAKAP
jgi:hypothetical protein